jgi:hypothetical protein
LAIIHSICEIHKDEILTLSQTRPTLKKLASVVQVLSRRLQHHKQQIQD